MKELILSESFKAYLQSMEGNPIRDLLLYCPLSNTEKCNYLTLRKGEKITFHPRPENQTFNEAGDWKREGRQEIKPLALIKLLFGEETANGITNTDIEVFTHKVKNYEKGIEMKKITFNQCFEYETQRDWYNPTCMKGKTEAIDFYSYNNDIFTPYHFYLNGELVGRSIKVKARQFTYFDRIYIKSFDQLSAVEDYLLQNGHIIKASQGYTYKERFRSQENGFFYAYVSVKIDHHEGSWIPYMDTLTFGDGYIMCNEKKGMCYRFESRSGDVETVGVYCDETSQYEDEEDVMYISAGSQAGHTYLERNVAVLHNGATAHIDDVCEVNSSYYLYEECVYSERNCEYYLLNDAVYSDHENDYIPEDEAVYSEIEESYLWEDRAVYLDYCENWGSIDNCREITQYCEEGSYKGRIWAHIDHITTDEAGYEILNY